MRKKFRVAILVAGLVAAVGAAVPVIASVSANAATINPDANPTAAQLLARVKAGCTKVSKSNYKTDDDSKSAIVSICKAGKSFVWNADMDVDCDGIRTSHCNEKTDCCFQNQTSFTTSKGKSFQSDLTHYYVIPLPSSRFSYTKNGIKPGSVAAIVYNNKVLYAVFADEGPSNIIGEASYATNRDLGINPDPKNGGIDCTGSKCPITYIVFPGVVPSPVESNSAIDKKGIAAAQAFLKS
jgi:hypothetical protein